MLIYDKLNSIERGATRGPFDYIKMADRTAIIVGDSTDQETFRAIVPQPAFRESGVIEIDATGIYTNGGAAHFHSVFTVDVAPLPPTDDVLDPNFGQLQAWTTVLTFETDSIFPGAGTGSWHLRLELHAEALDGASWTQCGHAKFALEPLPMTTPQTAQVQEALFRTAIDVSESFYLRLRFSTSAGASQSFDCYGARAGMRNRRDGF